MEPQVAAAASLHAATYAADHFHLVRARHPHLGGSARALPHYYQQGPLPVSWSLWNCSQEIVRQ